MAGGSFPGFRITYHGRRFELPSLLTSELMAIADHAGVKRTVKAVWEALAETDLGAVQALTWVAMKRQDPGLRLEQVDLDMAALDVQMYGECGRHPEALEQGPDGELVELPCPECAAEAERAAVAAPAVELVPDPTAAVMATAPAAVSAPMGAVPVPTIPVPPTSGS